MKVVHEQAKDGGTSAQKKPSTTAGLTSGYQRTSITTSGISAVANAAGYMLVEVATQPWYSSIPLTEFLLPSELVKEEVEEKPRGTIFMDANRQKLELDITQEFEFADREATLLIDETK